MNTVQSRCKKNLGARADSLHDHIQLPFDEATLLDKRELAMGNQQRNQTVERSPDDLAHLIGIVHPQLASVRTTLHHTVQIFKAAYAGRGDIGTIGTDILHDRRLPCHDKCDQIVALMLQPKRDISSATAAEALDGIVVVAGDCRQTLTQFRERLFTKSFEDLRFAGEMQVNGTGRATDLGCNLADGNAVVTLDGEHVPGGVEYFIPAKVRGAPARAWWSVFWQ